MLKLENLHRKYSNKLVIGYLNINFIRNKFEMFSFMISEKTDFLLISKKKLNVPFLHHNLLLFVTQICID